MPRMPERPRPNLVLTVIVLLLGLLALAPATADSPVPVAVPGVAAPTRPNVVFILADDLDLAMMQQLPGLQAMFGPTGTTFTHHLVSLSLCCPSRASLLRGQYAHNTGIYGNKPPTGGFETFHASGVETSTIATWLHDAGYRTALFGKYLNGYPGRDDATFIPPGWDEWAVPNHGNAYAQYDYSLNENGRVVTYGDRNRDYLTSVIARKATTFLTDGPKGPFFLFLAPLGPHSPATPPPRHANALPDLVAPAPPAFNEADLSDKPAWLRGFLPLGPRQLTKIDTLYRKRVLSMLGIQDLVADVVEALQASGQLGNTWIVFTSDNGFHMGEHRLTPGKNTAFDTDLRVPLLIRGPGVPAGRTIDALTANIDFAPTFAALAGIPTPDWVDGRSLLPLLHDPGAPWREALLLEHGGPESIDTAGQPDGSGLREPPDAAGSEESPEDTGDTPERPGNGTNGVPVFTGVRTTRHTYVRYTTGEQELYDNVADPDQLDNLATTADPALLTSLNDWTRRLVRCVGAGCREAESAEE